MGDLDGRVALVTGASSGIGNGIAAAFGREGADVVVADIRREPKLDEQRSVFDKLDEAGADSLYVETDVTEESDAEAAVEAAVDEFGGLDVVVNNAGIYHQHTIGETPSEHWNDIIDVNLTGAFHVSKAAIPQLKSSPNGKIINLASMFGVVGAPQSGAYCASKGGVANLTRQMAVDYAEDEINVNAMAPGVIKTAQNVEWRENSPDVIEDWERNTPWPEFGNVDDVTPLAVFLASDKSDFMTGSVVSIDGGWTAQ